MGRGNPEHVYNMGSAALSPSEYEKDLGVLVHKSAKPSVQVAVANQVLGQLLRAFTYRDKVTFVNLYKIYVRPHLEYAIQAWAPYTQHDIDLLENVQKRAIRQVSGLQGSYYDKLLAVDLPSLCERRARGDMIQTHRILHGLDRVDPSTWFTLRSATHTRTTRLAADPLTLDLPSSRLELRSNFFSVRVVSPWNKLPLSVRQAATTSEFKSGYDIHVKKSKVSVSKTSLNKPPCGYRDVSKLVVSELVRDIVHQSTIPRSFLNKSVISSSFN